MSRPEPENTRIQVVQGFSVLTYNFLHPRLPERSRRQVFDAHWPKWRGEFWECWYGLETTERSAAVLAFYPDGRVRLLLAAADGCEVYRGEGRFPGCEPDEILAEKLPASQFGERLLVHLREVSKLATGPTD